MQETRKEWEALVQEELVFLKKIFRLTQNYNLTRIKIEGVRLILQLLNHFRHRSNKKAKTRAGTFSRLLKKPKCSDESNKVQTVCDNIVKYVNCAIL